MLFRVGIENNDEGYRSIAWALEHPGCFAYGSSADLALDELLEAIQEYASWIGRHEASWIEAEEPELIVEQTFEAYDISPDFDRVESGTYTVNSFFQYDWKPLSEADLGHALKLLAWEHSDLLELLHALTPEQWGYRAKGERWDITGIVRHIGGANWWYLDRLGRAFPSAELPEVTLQRLEKVDACLASALPSLVGVRQVVGVDGELWSPRKLVRRAAWHMRDHTQHIRKLLQAQPGPGS
jgi:hypothetical protein